LGESNGVEADDDAGGVPGEEIGGGPTGNVEPAGAGAAVYCANRTPLRNSGSDVCVPLGF